MDAIIHKFTRGLPNRIRPSITRAEPQVVILTGSTGVVGAFALSALLANPSIEKIFCLNRTSSPLSRQHEVFEKHGLDPNQAASSKIQYIQIDLSQDRLGLDGPSYTDLTLQVDTIIHTAWDVSFTAPLKDFEGSHIRGLRSLIDFTLAAQGRPYLWFVSSVSAVWNWELYNQSAVPERLVDDPRLPWETGYGQSKFIAERILSYAAFHAGVRCSVIRVGQVGGPTTPKGHWKTEDMIPMMIGASARLGIVPHSNGGRARGDWVPSDKAGKIIADIVCSDYEPPGETEIPTFNVVNPHPISWDSFSEIVERTYKLRAVDLSLWLERMNAVYGKFPGIAQLIHLFEHSITHTNVSMLDFENESARNASQTFRSVPLVNKELVESWLQQWTTMGFIQLPGAS